MKKIKYFLFTLVIGGLLSSCYSDDALPEYPVQGLSDIAVTINSSNSVTGEGFGVPFTASLPQAFTSDATLETKLLFEGGFVASTSTIVPAGSTSVNGSISMQGDDGLSKFTGRDLTLSISGIALADQSQAFNITSNEAVLKSFDRVQWPYGAATIAGRMTLLIDWENPNTNDIDMYVFSETFDQVEAGTTTSRWETDIFNDTHPDGNYFVAIDLWDATGDLPWQLFFVDPDQTTVTKFDGIFAAADTAAGTFVFPLVNFTKSTDADDNVSYTYSLPTTKSFSKVQIEKMRSQIERRK